MGDCLLLTGPLRALKEEFPSFQLAVLVEERFAECFSRNPDVAEILAARGKCATAASLFTKRFDAIVNLHGGPTSLAYSCLARGKRIGFGHYRGSLLYGGLIPPPDPSLHTVESMMAAFHWLGLTRQIAPALRFEKQPEIAARIQQTLGTSKYVVLHPGAVMQTKRWDAARFAAVARELSARGFTIVVTAGPGEEASAGNVAQVGGSICMFNLGITELAELIRGAGLYIGNDSGPMHLAAAVGTPTVAVWGSSDSRRWRPWKVDHRVVQNAFECNPCPGYRCGVADSPLCIESVTVDQVRGAVRELLEESILHAGRRTPT